MSVSTYTPTNQYRLNKLAKVVYLIDENAVKNIQIDNGEAYIVGSLQPPLALKVYAINLSDTDALDERYAFTHQLSFSVNGYANYKDFQGRYYAIVKSLDGGYWMLNPMMPAKVTYTYTLDSGSEHTDFVMSTVSNYPTMAVHGLREVTPYECGYNYCNLESLKLNDKKYVTLSGNVVKYTNAGGFRTIDFDKNSCVLTETFDGDNIQHNITFNIKFSTYKDSWHINLLEFVDNKYAAIVNTSCGNHILTGFHFGLQPRFTVSATDDKTPDNIKIELFDVHDNGRFITYADELDMEYDSDTTWEFTYEHDGYECVSVNTARYLLKRELDTLGNPTGRYMCLEGYESQFENLDIVDTFEDTETFGNLTCGGRVCMLIGGFPSTIELHETGTSIDSYILYSDSDWNITSSENYITVSPSSGQAGRTTVISVTNSLEPTASPRRSTLTLHYCDNKTIDYSVVVKSVPSCFTAGDAFFINASRQYVTIPTSCCIQSIDAGDLAVTAEEDAYFAVYVPQNNGDSVRNFIITVTFCDGHTEDVMIEQTKIYERWVSEGYQCFDGQKCLVERKYTGTSIVDINFITDITRKRNCELSDDCSGVITKWVDAIGLVQAICDHGVKYRIEEELISYDGGQTWESNGKRRVGLPTADSPAECANVEEWNIVLNQYWCEGTTKYTKEQLTLNGEPQNVYRKGSEIIAENSTDCGYFVPPSSMLTEPRETDDYICDGYSRYIKMRWWKSDDGGNTWTATDIYSKGALLEQFSNACGYGGDVETRWWPYTAETMCIGTDLYYMYIKEESTDGGSTWHVAIPTTLSIDGEGTEPLNLAESASTECGYEPVIEPQYKWVLVENDYMCDECDGLQYRWVDVSGTCVGFDYHLTQKKQYSEDDGETWQDVVPAETQEVIEYDAAQCYPVPPTPTVYRWVEVSGICVGSDYHITLKKQYSEDGGQTWQDVVPAETREEIEYDSEQCQPVPPTPSYSGQYLTFRAREAGTFSFSNAMSYSLDSGTTWTTLEGGTSTPTIASGETVMWKGNSRPYEGGGIGTFSSTGEFDVEGNAMSLLFGDDFEGETSLTGKDYAFQTLFNGCSNLISAENLVLPATTLADSCYNEMFFGCTSLTTAPELPATTLVDLCYYSMFRGCTSLTTAPSLPATTLADDCYNEMFMGCTSLTTAPSLPATTLATTCYAYMFNGCTSLTTAPELPATTLANWCYYGMFWDCTSLNYIKCLATNKSATYCTSYWVRNVASSGTFIKDANTTWPSGTSGIPENWTVQDYSS